MARLRLLLLAPLGCAWACPATSWPPWPYDWARFPAFWFGADPNHLENMSQLTAISRYSLALFGWQHLQLASNYSDLLRAQVDQARRVKAALPSLPTFIYMSVADTQPFYAASAPLFADLQRFAGFFFLDDAGALWPNTTSHKCQGTDLLPACLSSMWNFFNQSARRFFLEEVVDVQLGYGAKNGGAEAGGRADGEGAGDEAAPAFDGVFFDAATTFMRAEGDAGARKSWRGAANAPPRASNATVLSIQAELLGALVRLANKHGKFPAFNSRLLDMSFANGKEQAVLGATGAGGLFRYYDLAETILDRALLSNALAESAACVSHLYAVRTPPSVAMRRAELAAFLLVRGPYDYFTFHTSYYDGGFTWHDEWDEDYGTPLGPASRRARSLRRRAPLRWSSRSAAARRRRRRQSHHPSKLRRPGRCGPGGVPSSSRRETASTRGSRCTTV